MGWTRRRRTATVGPRIVLATVLVVVLVGAPAAAQDVPAPDTPAPSVPAPSSTPGGASSTGLPSPTVDADGTVVSNSDIVALEAAITALVDELQDVADAETQAERTATEARDRLGSADRRVARTAVEAEEARVELARATTRLREADQRLEGARAARDEATEALAATEEQLAASREVLQSRLRAAWMHGGRLNTTAMVLGMDDFNDVARIQHLLGEVVEDDNQLVADHLRLQLQRTDRLAAATAEEERMAEAAASATESRAARSRAEDAATTAAEEARQTQQERAVVLDEVRDDLRALGSERLSLEDDIDQATAALDAQVEAELQRRREEAERREAEEAERRRRESNRLTEDEARAADLRAQHQRRIAEAAGDGTTSADVALPTLGCGSRSAWVWPTSGCVTSGFGYRTHPILGTRRIHAGVDIPAPSGTPIFAVAEGRVHRAGWSSGGHGNVVVIDHGEVATLYAHQVRVDVSAGQQVVAGQVIGWVGSTGLSTGAHLHLETHLDGPYGTSVDPGPWFR